MRRRLGFACFLPRRLGLVLWLPWLLSDVVFEVRWLVEERSDRKREIFLSLSLVCSCFAPLGIGGRRKRRDQRKSGYGTRRNEIGCRWLEGARLMRIS
jgi:hypothetical protein